MIAERIVTQLGLDLEYVMKVAVTATHRYKSYEIRKRTGGMRTIHHPSRELKLLQGWLMDSVFVHLPIHKAAFAYRRGVSIRNNAAVHVSQNYLLKIDFKDFFPSIKETDISRILESKSLARAGVELSAQDLHFIRRIVCREGALTIGAPSSPILSNAVMYEFDVYWSGESEGINVRYSRYADDVYFSTDRPGVLSDILERVRADLVLRQSPKLTINDAKTVFTSRKRRRLVTGLILTSDKQV